MELLSAEGNNPAGFAAKVVALNRPEVLWTDIRETAVEWLRRENGWEVYVKVLQDALPAHEQIIKVTEMPGANQ